MFWNKDGRSPERQPAAEAVAKGESSERQSPETQAVDTVSAILRSLGHYSFDLDDLPQAEIEETFERWARRLLLGENKAEATGEPGAQRGIQRDFGGVKRMVENHRRQEQTYVVQALTNLRQAVRELVQYTTASLRAEREQDALMLDQIDHLDRALVTGDHAQIRSSAEQMAKSARSQIELHRRREKETIVGLRETIVQLRGELDQARRQATIDALTQVYNRAALDARLAQTADESFLGGTSACVVMVDIDHFKAVNDTFGHQVGDHVLKQVADTVVRVFLRREDFVARYGGEEFCVVATHAAFEATRERAERLRNAVMQLKIEAQGRPIPVSVSFGLAALDVGESAASWLSRADAALYRAKQKGRNRISVAPPLTSNAAFEAAASPSTARKLLLEPTPTLSTREPTSSAALIARSEVTSAADDPGPPPDPSPPSAKGKPRAIAALLK